MARQRVAVSNQAKKRLRAQGGGKCANPGCPVARTHMHHIREWAVYETNDEEHMIAVCPTCHDAIHHGELVIADETVYAWKSIDRARGPARAHLYVEPASPIKLLLGSVAVASAQEVVVFEFARSNRLSFRVADGEIVLIDLAVRRLDGREAIRVTDNYVQSEPRDGTAFAQVPGRVQLAASDVSDFLPEWMLRVMRAHDPPFGAGGVTPVAELEVVKPGVVRVQGIWVDGDVAVIITPDSLNFVRPGLLRPISLVGEGEASVLRWAGPIGGAMFGFGQPEATA